MKKLILAVIFLIFCVSEIPAVPRESGRNCPPPDRYYRHGTHYYPHYRGYQSGPGYFYIRYHPYGYRHYPYGHGYDRRWFDLYYNDFGDRRLEGWYY